MSNDSEQFILQIQWDVPGLPGLVGPFDSREEAREWGLLNIANGSWNAAPLAYPYLRSTGEREPA